MRSRLTDWASSAWRRTVSDRLPLVGRGNAPAAAAADGDSGVQSAADAVSSHESAGASAGGHQHTYEELMAGDIPCPSCRGSGRIPKEMESRLVALIPVDDARLKPRRTWFYVLVGMLTVGCIFGITVFFLVPRTITIEGDVSTINVVEVLAFKKDNFMRIKFRNLVNITNYNYYSVSVTNATSTVINRFQPFTQEIVGTGKNTSSLTVAPRERQAHLWVENIIEIKGPALKFCDGPLSSEWPLTAAFRVDMTVTLSYLGHTEQSTVSAQSLPVCCIPTGNCSALGG